MKENDLVSSLFFASIDDKGRIVIPAYLRKRLNLGKDSKILVSISKPQKIERFQIKNFSQLKKILEKIENADEVIFDGRILFVINSVKKGD